MRFPRVVSIGVRNGQLCAVYFEKRQLVDWRRTRIRRKSMKQLRTYLHKLVQEYRPDLVVSEAENTAERKGIRARSILTMISDECSSLKQRHAAIRRVQQYSNKHEEALTLCVRYPSLKRVMPARRRVQDDEPRSYVFFEAVALAEEVFRTVDGDTTDSDIRLVW